MKSNQSEITALHFTRFLAAFFVVAYHYGKSAFPFSSGLLNSFIQNGGLSVSYFFALSGFIMVYAYNPEAKPISPKTFWLLRFARIYPVYILSFLLVLLLMFLFKDSKPKGISIILQALCFQAWKPGISMEINYVSWSIAVELLFYFIFPFLINYWRNKSLKTIFFQAITLWILSLLMHSWMINNLSSPARFNMGQFISFFPPWHLNSFILGAACGMIYIKKLKSLAHLNFFSQSLVLLSLILLYIFFIIQPIPIGYFTNGGIIPVFLLLIIGISINDGLISKLLSLKPLVWLGEISYGFYLWQFFIYLFFEKYLPISSAGLNTIVFYMYCFVLLIISAVSYHLFEVPIRKLFKMKFIDKSN